IVGASFGADGDTDTGAAYVVFGKASGFGTEVLGRSVVDLTGLALADGFVIQGDARRDYAGYSVSSAGDVNGDGFADLIVGAPLVGETYVLFGGTFGGSDEPVTTARRNRGHLLN